MSSSENIRVICRFRPLSKEEEQNKNVFVPTFSTKLNQVHFSENTFQFDKVLTDVSSQNNVYGAAAARTVQDAINGVNGTIFAYGQTGSGKTHTLEGDLGENTSLQTYTSHNTTLQNTTSLNNFSQNTTSQNNTSQNTVSQDSDSDDNLPENTALPELDTTQQSNLHKNHGLIPRVVHNVFHDIKKKFDAHEFGINVKTEVHISYYEVYNEKLYDLFDGRCEKRVTPDESGGCHVMDSVKIGFHCDSNSIDPQVQFKRFLDLYEHSKKIRTVRSTDQNYSSSRSHAVIQIDIKVKLNATSPARIGRINLVDLAGSEHVGRSVSSAQLHNKQLTEEELNEIKLTIFEGKKINLSLLTLSKCISALANKSKHVPYRESTITRILGSSLGGNCRTTIIVCCSPSDIHLKQTKSSLFFGVSAMNISNSVCRNIMRLTATQWRIKYEKDIGEKISKINELKDQIFDSKARVDRYKEQNANFRNLVDAVEQECGVKLEEKDQKLIEKDKIVADKLDELNVRFKRSLEKEAIIKQMYADTKTQFLAKNEMKVENYLESVTCIVCYDPVTIESSNTMTGCGHSGICDACAAWMNSQHIQTCPLCRKASTLIKLYFNYDPNYVPP